MKDKSKKLKCRLLQFLFSALRVKFTDCVIIWASDSSHDKAVQQLAAFQVRRGNWAKAHKTFFMLNSVEHEILNAHKYENIRKA